MSFSWLQSTILACWVFGVPAQCSGCWQYSFLDWFWLVGLGVPAQCSGCWQYSSLDRFWSNCSFGLAWSSSLVSRLFLAAQLSLAAQFSLVVPASLLHPATHLTHHLLPTELLTILSQPSCHLDCSNARSSCNPGTGYTSAASILVLSHTLPCSFVGIFMHTLAGLCTTSQS